MYQIRRRLVGLAALALGGPCWAHHSFSMFDQTKTVELRGTVRQFQWTNPHCFIQLSVPSLDGLAEWSIEMNSPLASYRMGWKPGTLKAGDTVTLMIHPIKDGTHGGQLVSATDSSGRRVNAREPKP